MSSTDEKILSFPDEYAMGQLIISKDDSNSTYKHEYKRALGDVAVAPSDVVLLYLSPPAVFHSMPELGRLRPDDLYGIQFPPLVTVSEEEAQHLEHLTGLRAVLCDHAKPQNSMLKCLKDLSDLKELTVCGREITDEGLPHIARLTSLEILSLNDTAITDSGISTIAGLKNLKRLTVYDTDITDKGISALSQLVDLIAWTEGSRISTPVWTPGKLSELIANPDELFGILDYKIDYDEYKEECDSFMRAVCELFGDVLPKTSAWLSVYDDFKEGTIDKDALQSTVDAAVEYADQQENEEEKKAAEAFVILLAPDETSTYHLLMDSFLDHSRSAGLFDTAITRIGIEHFHEILDS